MISLCLFAIAFAGWLCAHKRNVSVPVWVYVALAFAVVAMVDVDAIVALLLVTE